MKATVLSTIYPAALRYLSDFLRSLASQTDSSFDLVLVNDSVSERELETRLSGVKFPIHVVASAGTAAKVRKDGIRFAIDRGYDAIVFADSDDKLGPDRIAVSKQKLKEQPLFVNELILFGEGVGEPRPMLTARYSEGELLGRDSLREFNSMGLSNTAARADVLDEVALDLPDELIAFDWSLFAGLLERGHAAVFSAACSTFYRQYADNIASLVRMEESAVLRGVRVKTLHYRYMSRFGRGYEELAASFTALDVKLAADPDFRKWYCARIQTRLSRSTLWWEPIEDIRKGP